MTATKLRPPQASKLAASTLHAMNHFQAYPDLASPHSPGGEGGYAVGPHQASNGHGGGGGGGGPQSGNNQNQGGPGPNGPHPGHLLHQVESHQHFPGGNVLPHLHHNHHHHHHHHISSNNNNSTSATNNNSASGGNMDTGSPSGAVKVCAGCQSKIVERYLLHALDRYWHHGCLKCQSCKQQLADLGGSCFTKMGMILCKTDYARLFGTPRACSACGQSISANELVMRVGGSGGPGGPVGPGPGPGAGPLHVFHLKCFSCSKCGSQLILGDRYYLLGGQLVCEQDWHKLLKGSGAGVSAAAAAAAAGGNAPSARKGKVGRPRRSRD